MSGFRLYFRYVRLHMLTSLQYKGWPLQVLMALLYVLTDPIDALIMLDRFGDIAGWTASRILLMYGMAVCAFGLSELFARGFDYFPSLVRDGDFDRILLRPRSTFLQTMALRFHIHRLTRVLGAAGLAALCLAAQKLPLRPVDGAMLLLALGGGTLMYTGVLVISSAVAIFTVQPLDWIYIFTNGSYQAAKMPPEALPPWLRRTFTFVMPMLMFCYYPVAALWGGVPKWTGFLALPAGAAFLGASGLLWRVAVRHYKSTGS
ncbi:MAG: hypothetical protein GX558_00685 [Clostridiales bacterium]|nr:hypothetical protein [Clostridiales bacterium]